MTEAEWLACEDPDVMVDFLQSRALLSARKTRLFVVACCRIAWHLLTDRRSQQAVEVAERYADQNATRNELNAAYNLAWLAVQELGTPAAWRAWGSTSFEAWDGWHVGWHHRAADDHELNAQQATILRDISGNSFRRAKCPQRWRTDTALSLARTMYEWRDFGAMPILADALQDAGCDNDNILHHCRDTSATHVRGGWVVDLVLGKK
jgi:hypothetical protein